MGKLFLPVTLILLIMAGLYVFLLLLHVKLIAGRFLQAGLLSVQKLQVNAGDPVAYQSLGPAVGENMMNLNKHASGIALRRGKGRTGKEAPEEGESALW